MKRKHRIFSLNFDRILARDIWRQFGVLLLVLTAVFVVSYLLLRFSGCQWQDFCENRDLPQWLLPLYLLIDTNALNALYTGGVHGWALLVSTFIYVVGVFIFNGMIISVMTNAIDKRIESHRMGRLHYLTSGHYIILGYDEMVPSIIRYIFHKAPEAYVLMLTSAGTESVTEKLRRVLSDKDMKRIIVNYGHRAKAEEYRELHLEAAEQVYIVGRQGNMENDALNVECVDSICHYLEQPGMTQHPSRIVCVFKDLDTYAAFRTSEIFGKVNDLGMEFFPYNQYTGWAKQVFIKRYHLDMDQPGQHIEYPAVFGKEKGITPGDGHFVHLVFVGTTNFAVAFAMEAAQVLHFPNFAKHPNLKTRITFIDLNADKEKDEFITRNRHFFQVQSYYYNDLSKGKEAQSLRLPPIGFKDADEYDAYRDKDPKEAAKKYDFLDVEFEFIKGDIFSQAVQEQLRQWSQDGEQQYLSIFLAMADQRKNFVIGMNMPDEVYDNGVPIFIRQDRSDNFVTNLRQADVKSRLPYRRIKEDGTLWKEERCARFANIYPFGMNETAYCADGSSLCRAKLINYLYETADYPNYKFKGLLTLAAIPDEKIWEDAEAYWRKLSVALKWSNLYNAYTIRTKLASLRAVRGLKIDDESHDTDPLTEDEVEWMAQVEHNRWNVEKLLMGFRRPKPEEDKREHKKWADELAKNRKLYIHHDILPFGDLGDVSNLDSEFSRYIPWIMKMTTSK